ncbi:MAG TPA: hypothetical protein ENF61_00920 [Firmicutes bacterium]|nr:hypothetical protein [Bacillota bacterium]
MPWGDGTGPLGLGPMTGRAAGFCAGFPVPGFMNPWGLRPGFGWWGRGFGFGRGWRWRFYLYPYFPRYPFFPYWINPYLRYW